MRGKTAECVALDGQVPISIQTLHPPSGTRGNAAVLTRARLFAEWSDQPILGIGTHYAAPTAGHIVSDGEAFKFEV